MRKSLERGRAFEAYRVGKYSVLYFQVGFARMRGVKFTRSLVKGMLLVGMLVWRGILRNGKGRGYVRGLKHK